MYKERGYRNKTGVIWTYKDTLGIVKRSLEYVKYVEKKRIKDCLSYRDKKGINIII